MTRTKKAPAPEPEIWRPVASNDNYEVSSLGHVRRAHGGPGAIAGAVLKPWRGPGGHDTVTLSDRGRPTTRRVQDLVAEAFAPAEALRS